jgi:hypothetical protein
LFHLGVCQKKELFNTPGLASFLTGNVRTSQNHFAVMVGGDGDVSFDGGCIEAVEEILYVVFTLCCQFRAILERHQLCQLDIYLRM